MPDFKQRTKNLLRTADVWSHVYGLFGVISLVATIIFIIISIKNHETVEYKTIIAILGITISIVLITFIFANLYYQRKLQQLNDLPIDLIDLKTKNEQLYLIIKSQSECSHTINHYYRNIENHLDVLSKKIDNREEINEDECLNVLKRCKAFLLNTSISLQSFFTIATGITCSVTIKLALKDEKGNHFIKTLFRDPMSLKKRRYVENWYSSSMGVYPASENTAFDVILSSSHVNNFYAADNLHEEYQRHNYKNSNQFWNKHYNATIVVPISMITNNDNRNIIGFVAVDNLTAKSGNLNDQAKIEFLFSIGDLLYNFIQKYLDIITFANQKFKIDDFHKQIITWN